MTRRPVRRAFVLALVLPLLGGCIVTSKDPIIRPGEDGRDPALRGVWVTDKGREYLHVMRPELEDGKQATDEAPGFSGLYIVSQGSDADDRDNWARVRMITTTVKQRKILSMRFKEGEGGGDLEDMPGWLIFSYEIREGRLYLHMIEEDAVNAAIAAGDLAGKPGSGSHGDPYVTASAKQWIAWLEKADMDAVFQKDEDSYLVRLSEDIVREMSGAGNDASSPPAEVTDEEPR